jgi:hypothetical protein
MITGRRALLNLVALAGAVALSGPSAVWAQQKGSNLKQQLPGTWSVVSQYVDQDGKKTEPFGSNPKGSFMFDQNGRFAIILVSSSLPKVAANNRMKATPAEHKAIVEGSLGYFGSYTVGDDGSVTMTVEGSSYPNWTGETQKRTMVVKGDELRVTNPVANIGGTAHVVLKRVK